MEMLIKFARKMQNRWNEQLWSLRNLCRHNNTTYSPLALDLFLSDFDRRILFLTKHGPAEV